MKKILFILIAMILFMAGCGAKPETTETNEPQSQYDILSDEETSNSMTENNENTNLTLSVDGTPLRVKWENNSSVSALKELAADGNLTIKAHQYGGFEQVGSLPQRIESNDVHMTAEPGDIMLYSSNSVVVYYGTNTWSYTKLGHIENLSEAELQELLSGETVTLTFSLS